MSGGPSQQKQTTTTNQTEKFQKAGTESGTTAATTAGTATVDVPDWLKSLIGQTVDVSGTALGDFASGVGGYQIPPEALSALQSTAQGDYLYGGPQQQAFID